MGFVNAAEIAARQMELWLFPLVAWVFCPLALLFVPHSLQRSLGRSLRLSTWIAFAAYAVATLFLVPLPGASPIEAWNALYDVITTPAWRPHGMSTRAWWGAYTYCAWPAVAAAQVMVSVRALVRRLRS